MRHKTIRGSQHRCSTSSQVHTTVATSRTVTIRTRSISLRIGSAQIDRSVTHTRRVLYLRPYYALVLDTVDGTGTHTIDSHFDVGSPAVRIDPVTQAAFSQNQPNEAQIALFPLDREHLETSIIQGRCTGRRTLNGIFPTVQFRKQQAAPAVFATFLYPYKGAAPQCESAPLPVTGDDVWGQHLRTSIEEAEVLMEKNGKPGPLAFASALDGNVRVTAAGLVLRRLAGNADVYIGGWDITSLQTRSLQLTTDAAANLLVRLHGRPANFLQWR